MCEGCHECVSGASPFVGPEAGRTVMRCEGPHKHWPLPASEAGDTNIRGLSTWWDLWQHTTLVQALLPATSTVALHPAQQVPSSTPLFIWTTRSFGLELHKCTQLNASPLSKRTPTPLAV